MSESASRALKWTLIVAYLVLVVAEGSFAVSGGPRLPPPLHTLILVGLLGGFLAISLSISDRRAAARQAQAEDRARRRHAELCGDLATYMTRFASRVTVLEEFRCEVGGHLMRQSGRTTDVETRVAALERRHAIRGELSASDEEPETTQPICTTVRSAAQVPPQRSDGSTADVTRRGRRRSRRGGTAGTEQIEAELRGFFARELEDDPEAD